MPRSAPTPTKLTQYPDVKGSIEYERKKAKPMEIRTHNTNRQCIAAQIKEKSSSMFYEVVP
jgi:hypothetical protein